MAEKLDYSASGVDMQAGDQLVDWIQSQKPIGPHKNVLSGIGGFSALFKLDLKKYKEPILVSCTDGVGTKVRVAAEFKKEDVTGVDLVAMCVNDLITCGADPLFFLDYYATGKLDIEQAKRFLTGVRAGLEESDCALIGGETAEMPGHYQHKDYDCAGFCVGAIDKTNIIDGKDLKVGDVAIGIASSGFHSNGYSLLRKAFEKDIFDYVSQLMVPTRIYVPHVKALKEAVTIKAMAHITGNGIIGNIPRVMPRGTALRISKWPWPDLFLEVKKRCNLTPLEMLETFNCGVGFVVFVSPKEQDKALEALESLNTKAWPIGVVVEHDGDPEVVLP